MRIKDEKKYESIILASMQQFREDGFAKASIAKIAKVAGVSPATIYIHFENKEDLILKLYLQLKKDMSEYVLSEVDLDGCIESEYKKIWMNYYNFCFDEKDKIDYLMQFINSPYMLKYKAYDMCYYSKIYKLFEIGKSQGKVKKISDEILFAHTFYPAAQLAKRQTCCGTKICSAGIENACDVAWDAISDKGVGIECKKMKMNLRERMIECFAEGETEKELVGVEFEHFLVDKESLRSYHYDEPNGQLEIVRKMTQEGWLVDYQENDNIFSIKKDGTYISFEPGGQFEISIKAATSIVAIEQTYLEVKQAVEKHLTDKQILVSLGYHPMSKIDDLPLLPKARYGLMYDYLHQHGYMARNMMKGTASTQVIVDYKNEKDFIKKFRVANFLSPFIARLFDASPVFEGELYEGENLRIKIWENTDISRSKYPKSSMGIDFGYAAYADYIAGIKPIFLPTQDDVRITGDQTLGELALEGYLTDAEIEHGLSMAFPDVRLKRYLELRMPDALPYPMNFAIPTLIKGLFYNQALLDEYYDFSLSFSEQDLIKLNDDLKHNYDARLTCGDKSFTCEAFINELLDKVYTQLDCSEKKYLKPFIDFYMKHKSVSHYLKSVHGTPAFKSFLEGDIYV